MSQLLPPKKEVVLALLERSNVDIYLDPRAAGVVVPPQFRKEPRLILKIGLNMPVPIPDLRVDDDSMSCTLSFSRTPFYCVVPWSSVFAMVGEDGRGMVWPDDVPRELAMRVVDERRPPPTRDASPRTLSAVDSPREPLRSAGGRTHGKSKSAESPLFANAKKSASKKKKGEGRPDLRSVPPILADIPARAPAPVSIDKADAAPPSQSSQEQTITKVPAPAQSKDKASTRPKRELPPYLRVVK